MKKIILLYLTTAFILFSPFAFAQDKDSKKDNKDTAALLGLAGDNLDLYAVLSLFQKSKTIEAFEKSLNDEKEGINNLDLNLDKKVDFIKVTTKQDKQDKNAYSFILQVDVTKKETQDVAVILLNKDKNDKVSLQMVGDEELYGKDYIIEPKGNSSITPNPAYTGDDPVTVTVPASTTVVVQSAPIVQYVYSPAYVPYAPPYYYGYYPPWFGFATVMAVGIYRSNHYGYHGGYYGGHYGGGNTVVINNGNRNQINHYNNSRNRSNTVADNKARGGYGDGSGSRGGGPSASTRPANGGGSNRPSTGGGPSASTRPATGGGDRGSVGASTRPTTSDRSSTGASNRSSSSGFSGSSGRTRSSGGGGGGMRGGGGGGRRR